MTKMEITSDQFKAALEAPDGVIIIDHIDQVWAGSQWVNEPMINDGVGFVMFDHQAVVAARLISQQVSTDQDDPDVFAGEILTLAANHWMEMP